MEGILIDAITALTGSYPGKQSEATCRVCGRRGLYGRDIVDEDYVDCTGHDSVRTACRDVNSCRNRQRGLSR